MDTAPEHYFVQAPASEAIPKTLSVSLAGRDVDVVTAGGVFSPETLDRGTAVLLKSTPPVSAGPVLDMGCGWGPIALSSALDVPDAEVWAIDVNERALQLTRENAARLGLKNVRVAKPEEVPEGLLFGEIRSNPPIRVGKAVLHEILTRWLPRLAPEGVAYLVVAKHLGAESLARWIAESFPALSVERFAREKGFHVLRAERVSE